MFTTTFDPTQYGFDVFLYLWIEHMRKNVCQNELSVEQFYDLLKTSVKMTILLKIKEDMKAFKESNEEFDKYTYQEGVELIIADLRDCEAFEKYELRYVLKEIKKEWKEIVDSKFKV